MAVDDDLEVGYAGSPGDGHAHPWARLLRGPRGLPEDRLTAALDLGDHKLRPVLPAAVEHQVYGRAAAYAGSDRHPPFWQALLWGLRKGRPDPQVRRVPPQLPACRVDVQVGTAPSDRRS